MFLLNPFRVTVDPFFSTVVQLAHFDGTNGQSGGMTNSCPRGNSISITGGNGSLVTAQFVFGTTSMRQTGGPFSSASSSDYQFGNNDWTVEFRLRTDTVQLKNVFDMRDTTGVTAALTVYTYADGRIAFFTHGAERIVSSAGVIAATTWYGVAVSRVSGTTRMFVNGTQVGSNYTDGNNYNGIARVTSAITGPLLNANWDEIRVSNGAFGAGAGRYAANYTLATEPFPQNGP